MCALGFEGFERVVEGEPLGEADAELTFFLHLFEDEEIVPVGVILHGGDAVDKGVVDGDFKGTAASGGVGLWNDRADEGECCVADDAGGLAVGIEIDGATYGRFGCAGDVSCGERGGINYRDMTVGTFEECRMVGSNGVQILTRGQGFAVPLGVVPAAAGDPLTCVQSGSIGFDFGLHRTERWDVIQIDRKRVLAGGGHVGVGFVEAGHDESAVEVDALETATGDGEITKNTTDKSYCRERTRNRIEHAQVVSVGDFQRFHDLGIIASMQPSHLLTDMAWAGDRLGPERSKYAYAWKSFLDHGVVLCFGTDYPVESISPFRGLYSAVTRMNEAGTQTFEPQEKLTINQAIYAYTQASAYAQFAEHQKGILAPGYLADFVVLDRDITKATPQELLHTKVLRTVVGGVTRYTAPTTPVAETIHRSKPDGE